MNKAYDSRTADKFVVRLPQGLRDKIAAIAETNRRSMNSEIVMALEAMVSGGSPMSTPLSAAAKDLIDLVQLELGERTQERRDQDAKDAINSYMSGAGLPSNAMEVVVRGRTGLGKTTVLNSLKGILSEALRSAYQPQPGDHSSPPAVYMTLGNSTSRALEQIADRHDRVVFVTDFEQEQR